MPASPCCCICPSFIHYHVRQDHPLFCRDCPAGSYITGTAMSSPCTVFCIHPSIYTTGLHWEARAPCYPSIHPSIHLHTETALMQPVLNSFCVCLRQYHPLFCRDCPAGSYITGTALSSPCTVFCIHPSISGVSNLRPAGHMRPLLPSNLGPRYLNNHVYPLRNHRPTDHYPLH